MKISVYGLGRFGTFWAECLSKTGNTVVAYSRNPHPAPLGVSLVGEEEALSADILFFAVAISAFEEVLKRVSPIIGKNTIVADTCSVKVMPAKWMMNEISGRVYKVATHPMFGPDSGKNGIEGLPVVLSAIDDKGDERYSVIRKLFTDMGLKVIEMTPDEHDRTAAYSQGITHFIGRVLDEMNLKPTEIGTKGYKSLMTIVEQTCNDPWQLFSDLQKFNPYATMMRDDMAAAEERVKEALKRMEV